jgi:hypothetical protein
MPNHQSRLRFASQPTQRRIQLDQRFAYKFDPPVSFGQFVQNLAVENKDAIDGFAAFQGMVERRIVVCPQVASKPH